LKSNYGTGKSFQKEGYRRHFKSGSIV